MFDKFFSFVKEAGAAATRGASDLVHSIVDPVAEKALAVVDNILTTVFLWSDGTLVAIAILLIVYGRLRHCTSGAVVLSACIGLASMLATQYHNLVGYDHLSSPGILVGLIVGIVAQLMLITSGRQETSMRLIVRDEMRRVIREELRENPPR